MVTREEIQAQIDELDLRMFMSKQTDNAYAISGRYAADARKFWALKKELDAYEVTA
jgi:hypothetical protein